MESTVKERLISFFIERGTSTDLTQKMWDYYSERGNLKKFVEIMSCSAQEFLAAMDILQGGDRGAKICTEIEAKGHEI